MSANGRAKQVRRLIKVSCNNCFGMGVVATKNGEKRTCPECKGTGEVEKWINEFVNDDE